MHRWRNLYKPSPVIKLNIAIVESKIWGWQKGIDHLEHLEKTEHQLKSYYLFYATKAEFYKGMGNKSLFIKNYKQARTLTRSGREQELLDRNIISLQQE